MSPRVRRYLAVVMLIACLGALFWWVLPPNLGGRTTFFVTKGVSMEPYLKTNDLAILHKSRSYEVGDVVAFRARSLNAVLLHRIIANDNGQLTTQGDNNDFVDVDHPREQDVIGRLDHVVEGAGKKYMWIKSTPVRIAGAILVAWAIYGAIRNHQKLDDEEKEQRPRPGWTPRRSPSSSNNVTKIFGAALVLSGLLFLASSFVPTPGVSSKTDYSMQSEINYSAEPRQGGDVVYQTGRARTGDPLFVALIDGFDIEYAYSMKTDGDFEGVSTFSLDAVLEAPSGWKHTIRLAEPSQFEGSSFNKTTQVKISEMRELTDQIADLTQIRDNVYTLSIVPRVVTTGTLDGGEVDKTLESKMAFKAEKAKWTPTSAATTGPPNAQRPDASKSPAVKTEVKDSVEPAPDLGERVTGTGNGPIAMALKTVGFAGALASLTGLAITSFGRRNRQELDVDSVIAKLQEEPSEKADVAGVEDGFDRLEAALDHLDAMLPSIEADEHQVPPAEVRFRSDRHEPAAELDPT